MSLNPRFVLGKLDLTDAPYGVEFGSDLGTPENVIQVIDSLLADGQIERVTNAENRTLVLPIMFDQSDMQGLADAEAALAVECSKDLNELTIDPGDGFGAATVFQVFRGQLSFRRSDVEEENGLRRYSLTFRALPFGFSEDEVVDVAVLGAPGVPVTTVMANGSSATGWTSPAGSVTSSAGVLVVPSREVVPVSRYQGMDFRAHEAVGIFTFTAVDFSGARYVSADMSMPDCYSLRASATADGAALTEVAQMRLDAATVRYTWQTTDTSVTSLSFTMTGQSSVPAGSPAPTATLRVDNVSRSNVGPAASSTGREAVRSIEVTGSARTAGSVAIEHPTDGLGDVLFYTSKALTTGYSPALTQWRDGAGDVNGSTVSGYLTGASSHVFNVPVSAVPTGPHLLMLRAARPTLDDVLVTPTISTVIGSTVFDEITLPAATVSTLGIVNLGVVTLPALKFPDQSGAVIRITLTGSGSFNIDELWSFHMGDDSDLTFVRCGEGTPAVGTAHNRLFLDAPSINNGGAPALYVGTEADRSDAFHPPYPISQAWGSHPFAPPNVTMFVVTTGAASPVMSLRHRPAWFTHAGQ